MARCTGWLGAVLLGASSALVQGQQVYYYNPGQTGSGAAPARAAGRNYSAFAVQGHGFYYQTGEDGDGVGYGLAAILRPFSILAIDGGFDWYQEVFETELGDGSHVVRLDEEEEATDAFVGLRLYLSGSWPLQPYLTAGADYLQSDGAFEGTLSAAGRGRVSVEGDLDDAIGYHLGAGLDWVLNPNVALTAEARWLTADVDAEVNGGDVKFDLDQTELELFSVRAGLRIGF